MHGGRLFNFFFDGSIFDSVPTFSTLSHYASETVSQKLSCEGVIIEKKKYSMFEFTIYRLILIMATVMFISGMGKCFKVTLYNR